MAQPTYTGDAPIASGGDVVGGFIGTPAATGAFSVTSGKTYLLVVTATCWASGETISTPTGTVLTWSPAGAVVQSVGSPIWTTACFIATAGSSSASETAAVDETTTHAFHAWRWRVYELTSCSGVGAAQTAHDAGANSAPTVTITPTATNSSIFAALIADANNPGAPTGFTQLFDGNASPFGFDCRQTAGTANTNPVTISPTGGNDNDWAIVALELLGDASVGPVATGGSFPTWPRSPRGPRGFGARDFRTPQAYLPSPVVPDPNPATFRSRSGPMRGLPGPNPVSRFRRPDAFDAFSGNQIGQWRDVTPSAIIRDPNYPTSVSNFGCQDVIVDPANPNVVWAFFCYQGVWQSTDYGLTWVKISTPGGVLEEGRPWGEELDKNPNRDPTTPPRMYASNGFAADQGAFVSTDGGVSWVQHLVGSGLNDLYNFDTDPNDALHVISAIHGSNHVVESTDGGVNWTDKGAVTDGANSASQSGYVFFTGPDKNCWLFVSENVLPNGGIYKTKDAGATWKLALNSGHEHGHCMLYVPTVGAGPMYLPTGVSQGAASGLWRSTDYGDSWTQLFASPGATTVVRTKKYVYSMMGNASLGTQTAFPQRALVNNDTAWDNTSPFSSVPPTMINGAKRMAVTFDGTNYIIIAGAWDAFLWRWVEPVESAAEVSAYASTLPRGPRRGAPGPNPVSRFRSLQGYPLAQTTADLQGSIAGVSALSGDIGSALQLAGFLAGAGSAAGDVTLAEALAGALAGTSALAATVTEAVALAGSIAGQSAFTAALSEAIALQAQLAGVAALAGNVGTGGSVALQGAIAGAASLIGALTEAVALSGSLAGTSAAPGTLSLAEALAGSVAGSSALPPATIALAEALAGAIAGLANLTGNLTLQGVATLQGFIGGGAGLGGTVTETLTLAGSISGVSALAGLLGIIRPLQGSIAGASSLASALTEAVALNGTIAGEAALSAALREVVKLQGIIAGAGFVSGSFNSFNPDNIAATIILQQIARDLISLIQIARDPLRLTQIARDAITLKTRS